MVALQAITDEFCWRNHKKKALYKNAPTGTLVMKSQLFDSQGFAPRYEEQLKKSPFPLTNLLVIHRFSQQYTAPVMSGNILV